MLIDLFCDAYKKHNLGVSIKHHFLTIRAGRGSFSLSLSAYFPSLIQLPSSYPMLQASLSTEALLSLPLTLHLLFHLPRKLFLYFLNYLTVFLQDLLLKCYLLWGAWLPPFIYLLPRPVLTTITALSHYMTIIYSFYLQCLAEAVEVFWTGSVPEENIFS